jgi:hypothetical protein
VRPAASLEFLYCKVSLTPPERDRRFTQHGAVMFAKLNELENAQWCCGCVDWSILVAKEEQIEAAKAVKPLRHTRLCPCDTSTVLEKKRSFG